MCVCVCVCVCVYRNMKLWIREQNFHVLTEHLSPTPQFPMARQGKSQTYLCLKGFVSQERNSEIMKPRVYIGTAGISSQPPLWRERERKTLCFSLWNINKSSLGGGWEGLYWNVGN